jgi:hypothetical protein
MYMGMQASVRQEFRTALGSAKNANYALPCVEVRIHGNQDFNENPNFGEEAKSALFVGT